MLQRRVLLLPPGPEHLLRQHQPRWGGRPAGLATCTACRVSTGRPSPPSPGPEQDLLFGHHCSGLFGYSHLCGEADQPPRWRWLAAPLRCRCRRCRCPGAAAGPAACSIRPELLLPAPGAGPPPPAHCPPPFPQAATPEGRQSTCAFRWVRLARALGCMQCRGRLPGAPGPLGPRAQRKAARLLAVASPARPAPAGCSPGSPAGSPAAAARYSRHRLPQGVAGAAGREAGVPGEGNKGAVQPAAAVWHSIGREHAGRRRL